MTDPAAFPPSGTTLLPKPRLLVAEAQFPLGVFLNELLGADYDVETTTNGAQAWAAAQREPPDLVLADVRLPVLDGLQLARMMRLDARLTRTPIILLAANSDLETKRLILEAGADDFLLKPFRPLALLKCLRSQLARTRADSN